MRGSTIWLGPGVRRVAAVFAVVALLSLQPFCHHALAAAGNGGAANAVSAATHGVTAFPGDGELPSGKCCSGIRGGALVKPLDPPIPWTAGGVLAAALAAPGARLVTRFPRYAERISIAVPRERSFYARSSRILR
jgi:hypothetical protein